MFLKSASISHAWFERHKSQSDLWKKNSKDSCFVYQSIFYVNIKNKIDTECMHVVFCFMIDMKQKFLSRSWLYNNISLFHGDKIECTIAHELEALKCIVMPFHFDWHQAEMAFFHRQKNFNWQFNRNKITFSPVRAYITTHFIHAHIGFSLLKFASDEKIKLYRLLI